MSVAGQPWTSNNQTAPCTGTEELTLAKHKQENKLQFVFQAVYAVTHALRSLLRDECAAKQYGGGGGGGSKQRFSFKACLRSLRSINGEKLNALLRNTTYEGECVWSTLHTVHFTHSSVLSSAIIAVLLFVYFVLLSHLQCTVFCDRITV